MKNEKGTRDEKGEREGEGERERKPKEKEKQNFISSLIRTELSRFKRGIRCLTPEINQQRF
jgi:hypothetical protein